MNNVGLKVCIRCQEAKAHTEFNKDKATKDGMQSKCRECQRVMRKAWYEANREREIQKSVEWGKANPEKVRDKDRRRYQKNPSRRLKNKEYAKEHPDKMRQWCNDWKRRNPDKVRESARLRYAKNPDAAIAKIHKRRALRIANGGAYTPADVDRLRLLQKHRCACCRQKKPLTVDHVEPLARGGSNGPENLQLLCRTCNSRKNAKPSAVFMQENGYLL